MVKRVLNFYAMATAIVICATLLSVVWEIVAIKYFTGAPRLPFPASVGMISLFLLFHSSRKKRKSEERVKKPD